MQKDSLALFLWRTLGILCGIVLSLLFTITVLPSSAHNEADTQMSHALRGLLRLHGLVWLPMKDTPVLRPPRGATAEAAGGSGVKDGLPDDEVEELASNMVTWVINDAGEICTTENVLLEVCAAAVQISVASTVHWRRCLAGHQASALRFVHCVDDPVLA